MITFRAPFSGDAGVLVMLFRRVLNNRRVSAAQLTALVNTYASRHLRDNANKKKGNIFTNLGAEKMTIKTFLHALFKILRFSVVVMSVECYDREHQLRCSASVKIIDNEISNEFEEDNNCLIENIYPTTEELLASLYHKYEEPASEKIHSEIIEAIKRIENVVKLEKGEENGAETINNR